MSEVKEKKGLNISTKSFITAIVVIFLLMILTYILTFLVPGGVYARIPDGTGEFVDFETATKGKANIVTNPVVINEVQSNDKNDGPDWIEFANPTADELDVSGLVIKDNDDTHQYVIPEGTTIPANGFLVITEDDFGFGLGKNDSVRLYENEMLIGSTTWAEHTNPTWGLYPDVKGTEYRNTKEETDIQNQTPNN